MSLDRFNASHPADAAAEMACGLDPPAVVIAGLLSPGTLAAYASELASQLGPDIRIAELAGLLPEDPSWDCLLGPGLPLLVVVAPVATTSLLVADLTVRRLLERAAEQPGGRDGSDGWPWKALLSPVQIEAAPIRLPAPDSAFGAAVLPAAWQSLDGSIRLPAELVAAVRSASWNLQHPPAQEWTRLVDTAAVVVGPPGSPAGAARPPDSGGTPRMPGQDCLFEL